MSVLPEIGHHCFMAETDGTCIKNDPDIMLQPFLYAKKRYQDPGMNNHQNKIWKLQNCFQQFHSIMTQ